MKKLTLIFAAILALSSLTAKAQMRSGVDTLTLDQVKYRITYDAKQVNSQEDEATDKYGRKILTACFMVVEPQVQVAIGYSSNTDIDINKQHQQVSMNVNYGNLKITNPSQQIKTVVLQNGRWDQAVWNAKPDYISSEGLQWKHNRHLIFDAGNEYLHSVLQHNCREEYQDGPSWKDKEAHRSHSWYQT